MRWEEKLPHASAVGDWGPEQLTDKRWPNSKGWTGYYTHYFTHTRDCIRPHEASAAEGINKTYTAALEGVPFC